MAQLKPIRITSPDQPALDQLCQSLAHLSPDLELEDAWPARQLELCAEYGVFQWFMEPQWGGQAWSEADIVRGYLRLSAACLTTTFVITQRMGACQRLAMADNELLKKQWLPELVRGTRFATVGISHLTTSRRHVAQAVMRAEVHADDLILDGFSPWVTGATRADLVVTGATLDDGRQILVALPCDLPGVSVPRAAQLVGLSASQTGPLRCDRVRVSRAMLLAGPVEQVMRQGVGAKTGGLQTSTLALGLADSALQFLEMEAGKRADLTASSQALRQQWRQLHTNLLRLAEGDPVCTSEALRAQANSLVLRAAQAALAAAKGAGYVLGHPAGKWCREALFFLVWSCPQPVMAANLCELAGLAGGEEV